MKNSDVITFATAPTFTAIANLFGVLAGIYMLLKAWQFARRFYRDSVQRGVKVALARSRRRVYLVSVESARDIHIYITNIVQSMLLFFVSFSGFGIMTMQARLSKIAPDQIEILMPEIVNAGIANGASVLFSFFAFFALTRLLNISRNVRNLRRKWRSRGLLS